GVGERDRLGGAAGRGVEQLGDGAAAALGEVDADVVQAGAQVDGAGDGGVGAVAAVVVEHQDVVDEQPEGVVGVAGEGGRAGRGDVEHARPADAEVGAGAARVEGVRGGLEVVAVAEGGGGAGRAVEAGLLERGAAADGRRPQVVGLGRVVAAAGGDVLA